MTCSRNVAGSTARGSDCRFSVANSRSASHSWDSVLATRSHAHQRTLDYSFRWDDGRITSPARDRCPGLDPSGLGFWNMYSMRPKKPNSATTMNHIPALSDSYCLASAATRPANMSHTPPIPNRTTTLITEKLYFVSDISCGPKLRRITACR